MIREHVIAFLSTLVEGRPVLHWSARRRGNHDGARTPVVHQHTLESLCDRVAVIEARQKEWDARAALFDLTLYCICGRAEPCRHQDDPNHGLLSYYEHAGPEKGGPIRLDNEDDIRRALIALQMRAQQLGVKLP